MNKDKRFFTAEHAEGAETVIARREATKQSPKHEIASPPLRCGHYELDLK
jgi:hypothetical protein